MMVIIIIIIIHFVFSENNKTQFKTKILAKYRFQSLNATQQMLKCFLKKDRNIPAKDMFSLFLLLLLLLLFGLTF